MLRLWMLTFARLGRQLQDALLLKRSEAVVRDHSPAQQAMIRQLYRAAIARIALADQTTDDGTRRPRLYSIASQCVS